MDFNNFNSHKNRGMLLEKIINNSINYYVNNKIAFFSKNHLNIKFNSVLDDKQNKIIKLNNSFIKSKSTVDYYGVYKGKYITFEAKSTEEDLLPLSNIKPHQHKHLLFIESLGGYAFYIFYFKHSSKIYMIKASDIDFENKKSISLDEAKTIGNKLDIVFPGVIDFLNLIHI